MKIKILKRRKVNKFDKPANRWNYYEKRFDEKLNYKIYKLKGKVYNFGIADPNYQAPIPIIKSLTKRVKKGTYSYSYISDLTFEGIQQWYKKKHNLQIEIDWIKIVHGTINAMYQMVQAFTQENDYVLIQIPIYKPFAEAISFNNRKIANNKLIYNQKKKTYQVDFKDFEKQIINHKIKLFMLCSPHNPGSVVWDAKTIKQMVKICQRHHVLIFSDEVHSDIVFKPYTSIVNFNYDNFVLGNSPNKAFNLGGIKSSYLIIKDKKLRETIDQQYKKNAITSINFMVNFAYQPAFLNNESYQWLENLKKYIWKNYQYFKIEIENLGWEIFDLESTYLTWIKIPKKYSVALIVEQLKKNNIIICDYTDFYGAEDDYIRINIATAQKELKYLVDVFKKIIK